MTDTILVGAVRIVALLQIVGGVLGLLDAISALVAPTGIVTVAVILAGLLIFSFGIFAGVVMWVGQMRGYILSRILQLLQLPLLTSPFLSYQLGVGYFAHITYVGDDVELRYATELGTNIELLFGGSQVPFHFGINIVALAAIVLLNRRISALRREVNAVNVADAS